MANALSHLPVGPDTKFDSEEETADVDTVCTIRTISLQLNPTDQGVLAKESANCPVMANIIRYTTEGWPPKTSSGEILQRDCSIEDFRILSDSLFCSTWVPLVWVQGVIPPTLQHRVLQLLQLGHFSIQRMKQLARTVVYWPKLGSDIVDQCRQCSTCAENQKFPAKAPNHPWMLPEKPWSRVHIDHACHQLLRNKLAAHHRCIFQVPMYTSNHLYLNKNHHRFKMTLPISVIPTP